jgi:DNA repair ATPase RecN
MENAQTLVLDTINGLLEENMIEKALDSFKDLDKQTEAGIWQEITLQYSRYRSAQQAQNQGRIPYSEFSMYENQIKYALTELMKSVPRKIELNAKIRSVKAYDFEVPNKERFEKMIGKTSNLLGMEWFEKARKQPMQCVGWFVKMVLREPVFLPKKDTYLPTTTSSNRQ